MLHTDSVTHILYINTQYITCIICVFIIVTYVHLAISVSIYIILGVTAASV